MYKTIAQDKKLTKLREFIALVFKQEIENYVADPDSGLVLRPSVLKRLKKSKKSQSAGRLRSLDEVVKRLGI